MKATINGVTYEGSEEEIRRIVENPPNAQRINYPSTYPDYPTYPAYPTWPPTYPDYPSNTDWPWGRRNWDGSPVVTCYAAMGELI